MNYFVTGTDTGTGKTLISCAILECFAAQGKRVAGFKPVASGRNNSDQNEDAVRLRSASTISLTYSQVNPYCLHPGIAPHIAAEQAGISIDCSFIADSFQQLTHQAEVIIVEGVGGLLVPLNFYQDSADLVKEIKLPVILVVGMRLGCLNHALLTVEAIDKRGLTLAGWVANVLDDKMPALQENIDALCKRINAPMLGVVPYLPEPNYLLAAKHLNLDLL